MRIAETEHGMLNAIGLANPGRDRVPRETSCRGCASSAFRSGSPSAGSPLTSTRRPAPRSTDVTIELNLSCPNVDEAAESAAEIVAACRAATELPLYAKLSPATWDVAETARAVEAAGADGLSLVNTIRGLALDERTLRPTLERGAGGYSGPALKPIALAAVYACARATTLPIVGMGGVRSGLDALELIAARSILGRARNGAVRRPRRAGPRPRRARRRTERTRLRFRARRARSRAPDRRTRAHRRARERALTTRSTEVAVL